MIFDMFHAFISILESVATAHEPAFFVEKVYHWQFTSYFEPRSLFAGATMFSLQMSNKVVLAEKDFLPTRLSCSPVHVVAFPNMVREM
jgi:hypothetical protein